MQKKFDNKYIYAGITGFCVLAALLICTFLFIHIDTVFEWFGRLNSALMPIYIAGQQSRAEYIRAAVS